MKFITLLALFLFSCLAVAIPIATETVAVPEEVITVWVDQHGQTVSVETVHPTATATVNNEPTALHPILAIPDQNAPNDLEPALASDTNIKANTHLDPKGGDKDSFHSKDKHEGQLFGISYSPYNADSTCKSQDQVNSDLDKLTHYAYVRIYGIDCDQTRKVINAARRHNMQVFAGVWSLQNLHADLNAIIDAARPDLSTLHTISIGNELLNRGQNSAGEVTAAVNDARAYLRSLGYNGPVVTVDTYSKIFEHPELCQASDYCAANCHAFFDATQTHDNAGAYVAAISRRLSEISGGKRTVITESGWPHGGQNNGRAVPSWENHKVAIDSLRKAFGNRHGDLVLFSAFDDLWKIDNQWTFGAEKFWGIETR
ncbi:putative cell wall glucanase (Scw4) [Aspergillus mulundensis]|uniref:Putative beta transglucosylase, GH17 family n=1 Tax=Aspergillus mulundensis TaxID=1810919 RepID=A0A3D8T642_9EURO|nr:putative beta transglucosylase, GH17 family [Aspergillus mulundensis]RDW94036.1 putative beta transglucosylase, GH17 family [Aspergillus mulundensis]